MLQFLGEKKGVGLFQVATVCRAVSIERTRSAFFGVSGVWVGFRVFRVLRARYFGFGSGLVSYIAPDWTSFYDSVSMVGGCAVSHAASLSCLQGINETPSMCLMLESFWDGIWHS